MRHITTSLFLSFFLILTFSCFLLQLLLEAEANGKIDRRKHDIAMNFCGDHINRMSYYLNTPPGFWNCNEMPPPRNGHLHPLIVPDSDDDDFVKDSKSK